MTFFRCFVKKRGRCGVSPLEGVAENAVVELVETMAFGVRGRSPFGSIFNGSSIVGWGCPKSNECSAHWTTRRNDCYTKCGGFDKLNHRNANLLDSPLGRYFEPTEKVPITAFLFIFSVTLFKNYRKRTLKILRSEVFQWPRYFSVRCLWFLTKFWFLCVSCRLRCRRYIQAL